MKANWAERKLSEVARIEGGGTPKRTHPEYFSGDIPWITPTDLDAIGTICRKIRARESITEVGLKNSSAKLVPAGSVLFSSRATIGKIAITDIPCATNQGFANFIPDQSIIDPEYLAYALSGKRSEITNLAGKTTFLEVPRGRLKEFKIPVPPLEEQRRIVARIKECMERVEEIERLRSEANTEAIALSLATFADFVHDLSESDAPIVKLGDVVTSCKYGSSKKSDYENNGLPILRMGNIKEGKLDVSDLKRVQLSATEAKKYLLQDGDILVNRTNSLELVGKSGLFQGLDGDWVYASYLVRLRVDGNKAIPSYVNGIINSRIGREYVLRTARRAIGQVNINAKEIQAMPFPLPPLEIQAALVEKNELTGPIIGSIREEHASPDISHLRDAILRKAFAGEL